MNEDKKVYVIEDGQGARSKIALNDSQARLLEWLDARGWFDSNVIFYEDNDKPVNI
jgi:hypothetical protein